MPITNSQIKRAAPRIFSSSRAYETTFYNRKESKAEIKERFKNLSDLKRTAYFISAPLGTGKTFFIDVVGEDLGVNTKKNPLILKNSSKSDMEGRNGQLVYIDEADVKTEWKVLREKLYLIREHLHETGRTAIIIGDYCLRNDDLVGVFEKREYLNRFEPLDKPFLKGVIKQRVEQYLGVKMIHEIIEEDLYDILVSDEMAEVSSFRGVLSTLEQISRLITGNSKKCLITVEIARQWAEESYDPNISTDQQEDFFNIFLEFISEKHGGERD